MCSSLCPEAELYVKQDYVGQREKPIGLPRHRPFPNIVREAKLTKLEVKILTLFLEGKNRKQVCKVLNISRHSLRVHLTNIRKKY